MSQIIMFGKTNKLLISLNNYMQKYGRGADDQYF